jgi:hypothetical protein
VAVLARNENSFEEKRREEKKEEYSPHRKVQVRGCGSEWGRPPLTLLDAPPSNDRQPTSHWSDDASIEEGDRDRNRANMSEREKSMYGKEAQSIGRRHHEV